MLVATLKRFYDFLCQENFSHGIFLWQCRPPTEIGPELIQSLNNGTRFVAQPPLLAMSTCILIDILSRADALLAP